MEVATIDSKAFKKSNRKQIKNTHKNLRTLITNHRLNIEEQ